VIGGFGASMRSPDISGSSLKGTGLSLRGVERMAALDALHQVMAIAKKRGPKAPKNLALRLFAVAAVAVVGVGRQDDESTVYRKGLEFNAEPDAFLVRECGADLGPALLCFAVPFVLFDGEDIEVGGGRCFCGCSGSGLVLIAIVHFQYS
jgi:hypothetical protein